MYPIFAVRLVQQPVEPQFFLLLKTASSLEKDAHPRSVDNREHLPPKKVVCFLLTLGAGHVETATDPRVTDRRALNGERGRLLIGLNAWQLYKGSR